MSNEQLRTELEDRLADQALEELFGGKRPPELQKLAHIAEKERKAARQTRVARLRVT